MEQIYNPILPLTEYIPDGEPHVFGDRIYLYGSHDEANGSKYCPGDYVVWSAPIDDLHDWKYEGVSYRKDQDPLNASGEWQLYAPDVTRGKDGKYYLYYCFSSCAAIGVAVSEDPAGPFTFYGHVEMPSNAAEAGMHNFDPGVFTDDDGRTYLFFGFHHAWGVELNDDMLTMKGEPKEMIPACEEADRVKGETGSRRSEDGFGTHRFFEASSMRKINGRYYFIYSDEHSYNLCYATSDSPLGDFSYGGVLVASGDMGLNGAKKPIAQFGNIHGSIAEVVRTTETPVVLKNAPDQILMQKEETREYYVFYHRQTNGTEYSRQACAEKLTLNADGSFDQAEVTSCGLNGAPLSAAGMYPAAIACHIADRSMQDFINYKDESVKNQIRVTQNANQVYVTGIKTRSKLGFKYFGFMDSDIFALEIRGHYFGRIIVSHDELGKEIIGECELQVNTNDWELQVMPIAPQPGVHPLYIYFKGKGDMEMKSIGFVSA